ncbi:MAG: hypothetical protein R3E39_08340 [Anaerolineae bacterium]
MESRYCEMEQTDEQYQRRLSEAMVESLLDDWTMISDVCLSPLLVGNDVETINTDREATDEDGGVV